LLDGGVHRFSITRHGCRDPCRAAASLHELQIERSSAYIVDWRVDTTNPDRNGKISDFSMLNEVYNRRIIELAGTIPRIGRLAAPDASAIAHSRLCGSTVTIDLKMDGDTVTDFAHEVKACALGQASSSIMARNIIGSKADELRELRESVRKMLKENGAPPADGKWADIAVLEPVRDYKARHASTLLTFDAVVDAIAQIEAKRGTKTAAR
jgi:NifU-like protein involved in Fe-S cluster formation